MTIQEYIQQQTNSKQSICLPIKNKNTGDIEYAMQLNTPITLDGKGLSPGDFLVFENMKDIGHVTPYLKNEMSKNYTRKIENEKDEPTLIETVSISKQDERKYIENLILSGNAKVMNLWNKKNGNEYIAIQNDKNLIIGKDELYDGDYIICGLNSDGKIDSISSCLNENFNSLYQNINNSPYEIFESTTKAFDLKIAGLVTTEEITTALINKNKNICVEELSTEDYEAFKKLKDNLNANISVGTSKNGTLVIYDIDDKEKVESLIKDIKSLSREEKENIGTSIDNPKELEYREPERIRTQKNIEKQMKEIKKVVKEEKDRYLLYLEDKASGIDAMSDEELTGFYGEVNSYHKVCVSVDNTRINDQIKEERESEVIDNVSYEEREAAGEKGYSMYSEASDMVGKIDDVINEEEIYKPSAIDAINQDIQNAGGYIDRERGFDDEGEAW